jgi:endonuclease YncB( thermonuclease family)
MTRILAALSMALICLSPALQAQDFQGRVVGVKDGDTIEVMHEGKAERVRLAGIDCPESGQPFSAKAEALTSELVFRKDVTIKAAGKDKYGRTLGEVILLDGRSLNKELLSNGLAWWYREYSSDPELARLEIEARDARRGLWTDYRPVPPWEWRRGSYSPADGAARLPTPTMTETANPEASSGSQAEVEEETVYVTRTGSKYHRSGCRYLRSSAIPMSLSRAKESYSPCSICNPPVGKPLPGQTLRPAQRGETVSGDTTPTGKAIYVGPRGGRYHYSKSGKKVYERRR